MQKIFWTVGATIIGVVGTVIGIDSAEAHLAEIQARITSGVEIQVRHEESGDPLPGAPVSVYGPKHSTTPVFTGKTDSKGTYYFLPTQSGDWTIQVTQGSHGDTAVVPIVLKGSEVQPIVLNEGSFEPWQQAIIVGSVLWGAMGTTLYFRRKLNV